MRQYLKGESIDDLADMILDVSEQDPWRCAASWNGNSPAGTGPRQDAGRALAEGDDAATPTGKYLGYREAQRWRNGVYAVLDTIGNLASGPRAGLALKLVEYAVERIAGAFEAIDNSDGHLGDLFNRAREIHLAAAGASRPEPVALARYLFEQETESDFGPFAGAVEDYAEVLGDQGLGEYRRLAIAAWDKLLLVPASLAMTLSNSTP